MSLAKRLRDALARSSPSGLLAGDLPEVRAQASVEAAVLVAVTDRSQPGLILTVRRENMRTHAGQIAFPGGRIDAGEGPTAAALREAQEELGLEPGCADVIGELHQYRTVTGYKVTPVLSVVPPDLPLTPHEHEVADWFEAPLAYVLDPANQQRRSGLYQGRDRYYYEILWNGRRIWGATAAMIVNLERTLQWT